MNSTNYNVVLFKSGQDLLTSTLVIAGYSFNYTENDPVPEQRDDLNKWILRHLGDNNLVTLTDPKKETDETIKFNYTFPDNTKLDAFNFLIFCNSSHETFGVIYFTGPQKLKSNSGKHVEKIELKVTLEKSSEKPSEQTLYLHVISSLINTVVSLPTGDKDWQYTTKLPDYTGKGQLKYTNKLSLYLADISQSLITESTILTHHGSGYTWINDGLDLGDYDTVKTSLYKGDIVLFLFNSIENPDLKEINPEFNYRFKLLSLTKINSFGVPMTYSSGSLNSVLSDKNRKFKTFYSNLAVFEDVDEGRDLFIDLTNDLDSFFLPSQTEGRLIYNITDSWDESGKIYTTMDLDLAKKLNRYLDNHRKLNPDNKNFIDINETYDRLFNKVGCWYGLKRNELRETWISPKGELIFEKQGNLITNELVECKLYWITEKLILLKVNLTAGQPVGNYSTYLIPINSSYNKLVVSFNRESGEHSQPTLKITLNDEIVERNEYNSELYDDLLDGLRRKPIRGNLNVYDDNFPLYNILDVLRGLVFYKDVKQNKLYLL